MRFDWFVPFHRKGGPKDVGGPARVLLGVARRVLPRSWQSDTASGRSGGMRRALKSLGSTWLYSPFRRVVQALCLLAFLGLFLYVCWPYTARPRPVLRWENWLPIEVDAQQGRAKLAADEPSVPPLVVDQIVHVTDTSLPAQPYLGRFRITRSATGELDVEPDQPLNRGQLESLATSFGPWTLSDTEPGRWPSHYADDLRGKERVDAELFLILDPLVSLSTAVAVRAWVWSLTAAGIILLACVLIPRGFCGYLCPLGTVIDLFDWAVSKRIQRFRVTGSGWWVHLKYYLLVAVFAAACLGVVVSGYVAAIPVVTRAAAFALTPLETNLVRDWQQIPHWNAGHGLSMALFFVVLLLGLLQPRFWCRYVCPTGAVFSLGNLFRLTQRKVESTCIHCNKCVQACPFDAIKADFTTRTSDCTFCQTCGGACPVGSIKFVGRWDHSDWKAADDPPTKETSIGRRGFLSTAAGVAAGFVGGASLAASVHPAMARGREPGAPAVRPPGSVPETEFLELCIRCGECFQACPNDVLQPMSLRQGLLNLWTPEVVADWSGCEPSCSNCGQVCPTGAIRALTLDEKRVARMGLAAVNETTCLPFAGKEDCQWCVDECNDAGYEAIVFVRSGTELGPTGEPLEGSGFLAPVVSADKCVGCGLCQMRCFKINVKDKKLLSESAIVIEAGEGREDRLLEGSYLALREQEQSRREAARRALLNERGRQDGYLPDFLVDPAEEDDIFK